MFAPLLLASTLASGQPATEAYTGIEPVQVASCSVAPQLPSSYFGVEIPGVSTLNISFVNRAPKTISKVEFAVSDGAETLPVVDAGTFSQGATIDHDFTASALIGNVSCAVRSVAFADGSTWQAQ
jgi:hypothetical protein